MKYAAIDIGSNAVRLLIANIIENGEGSYKHKKSSLVRVPIRLGTDVFSEQQISEKSQKRLIHAMKAYRLLMKVHGVTHYRACATSAFREAENGEDVVNKIYKKSGIQIDLISGEEEARIIYSTHIEKLLEKDTNILYVDVGGGSTEISLFGEHGLKGSKSFRIGTVRLLQNNVEPKLWEDMTAWLETTIKGEKVDYVIGSGGNINKLVKLSNEKTGKVSKEIYKEELEDLYAYLTSFTYEERQSVVGLNPDRADVIIPASDIFLSILRSSDIPKIYVPKIGLTDGLIIEMYDNEYFKRRKLD